MNANSNVIYASFYPDRQPITINTNETCASAPYCMTPKSSYPRARSHYPGGNVRCMIEFKNNSDISINVTANFYNNGQAFTLEANNSKAFSYNNVPGRTETVQIIKTNIQDKKEGSITIKVKYRAVIVPVDVYGQPINARGQPTKNYTLKLQKVSNDENDYLRRLTQDNQHFRVNYQGQQYHSLLPESGIMHMAIGDLYLRFE